MRLLLSAILLSAALAGCSSVSLRPAPVVASSAVPVGPAAAASSAAAAAAIPPGYYRVQRGDTLRSIARSVGRGWRELATWNQLSDPNRIEVGQLLRVAPPGAPGAPMATPAPAGSAVASAAQTFPVAPQGGATSAPASTPAPPPAPMPAPAPASSERARASAPAAQAPAARGAQQHAASAPRGASTPQPAATTHAGALTWSWPAQGRIIRGFNGSTSKGLDIAGQAGEPVRAAAAGKVVYAGNELRGFGNLVIVKHNADYISVYAHNQKLLVHEGEQVRRGQTLALMGSTDASRVELHFEVRLRGKPIDPTQVLPPR